MDRIRNAIKCAICREILESPVFLPCSDPICTKHASNQTNDVIRCEKCGIEHRIPITGFPPIPFLEEIIKSEFGQFDFGSVHKEAKRSCESVHEALKEALVLFRDPYFYTHEKISELKNNVQLKGEELKLIIDQEMKKLIDKLEEYDKQCRDYLSSNEFKEESKKLENEMKLAQTNLDSWLESLNKYNRQYFTLPCLIFKIYFNSNRIKFDEDKWKSIREESSLKLKRINEESEKFRNKLLLNKFKVNQKQVNLFKCIKIDSIFEYGLTR